jgi:hypothetical protein
LYLSRAIIETGVNMSDEKFDPSELKIRALPKPPGFGPVLGFLAIGLTLAAVRLGALIMQLGLAEKPDDALTLEWFVQLLISAWAIVNLVLLITRRRLFINSMIALFASNVILFLGFAIIQVTRGSTSEFGSWLLVSAIGAAIGALWIAYLFRSQHVRRVCVR